MEVSKWQDDYILSIHSGNVIKAGAELDKELTFLGKPIQLQPSKGKIVNSGIITRK